MAVSAPPKRKESTDKPKQHQATLVQEKKIEEIINRGGSPVGKTDLQEQIKNFNIKIMSGQLAAVDELRAQRPRKPTSPKMAVSLQDWIIEAIEEKIQREKKKYKK